MNEAYDFILCQAHVATMINVIISGDFQAEADINGDGAVDLFDVTPFVDLLIG